MLYRLAAALALTLELLQAMGVISISHFHEPLRLTGACFIGAFVLAEVAEGVSRFIARLAG